MEKQTVEQIIAGRRMIEGPKDLLRSLSARKYGWTKEMTKAQEKNRWFPSQVNVLRDSIGFETLRSGSKTGYKRALAFVSNLDAIQCDNLAENLYPHITDPHVQQCIATQIAEEWIHVESYSNLIETVVKGDALEIYQMYKDVPQLAAKNDHVIAQGRAINAGDGSFGERFVKAVCANIALEGVYFFSGFTTIYAVGRDAGGQLNGSVDTVKYIQRDEQEHLWMFTNIWHNLWQERPELFTKAVLDDCRSMIVDAVHRECAWGDYVLEEGVPLLDSKRMTNYIRTLGNECAINMGIGELWKGQTHELTWVKDYQMNKGHKNFFEGRVGTYQHDVPTFSARKTRAAVSIGSMIGRTSVSMPNVAAPAAAPRVQIAA